MFDQQSMLAMSERSRGLIGRCREYSRLDEASSSTPSDFLSPVRFRSTHHLLRRNDISDEAGMRGRHVQ